MTGSYAKNKLESPQGLGMVESIRISNYRGFEKFWAAGFAPINIIVGDNAVGKTSLLEAIWVTLSASPQKLLNLREWRGMPLRFQQGSAESLVPGMFADIFHDPNSLNPVEVELVGAEYENRSMHIKKRSSSIFVPIKDDGGGASGAQVVLQNASVVPLEFSWRDQHGDTRSADVTLHDQGINFGVTGENLPNAYLFASQAPIPATEPAGHYSALVRNRAEATFLKAFQRVFPEVTKIAVDSTHNEILVDVAWAKNLIPIQALSGGATRTAAILLAMAQRKNGCVLVDEIESGIYFKRQEDFASALLEFASVYETQLFLTSHSEEWLQNFAKASRERFVDIAFWRMERSTDGPQLLRFDAQDFFAAMTQGVEVR